MAESIADEICEHIAAAPDHPALETRGCQECLAIGGRWVHLRRCLECGHVGCCDSSPNTHASKHYAATGHPVIQSFQPDEDWRWCFIDELFVE